MCLQIRTYSSKVRMFASMPTMYVCTTNSLHILSFSNLPWYATYARGTAKANIARATWCIPRRSTLHLTAPRPHTFSRKIAQVRKPGDLFPKRCKAETSSSPVDVPQRPVEPWQANPFKSFAVLFHRSPTHLVAQKNGMLQQSRAATITKQIKVRL